jgi:hypothetical protein
MDDLQRLNELRELFRVAPESEATRILALVGSVALTLVVLHLVRRRALREEYTPIWMAVALGLLVISLDLDLLRFVTRAIGAWTASSTLFFLGEVFLLIICLNFAVRLSQASLQIKTLGQELALLRAQLQDRRVSESIVSPRP